MNIIDIVKKANFIDCTLEISPDTQVYGDQDQDGVKHTVLQSHEAGYFLSHFSFQPGSGTHMDAPYHFFNDLKTISDFDQRELMGRAYVLDISKYVFSGDECLTMEQIKQFQQKWEIEQNSFFFLKTGWIDHLSHETSLYKNIDQDGVYHFPGYSLESASYLQKLGIKAIGIDTLSIDPGNSQDLPVHKFWLGNNLFQMENVDLSKTEEGSYDICIITPLKIKNAGESPCSILLFKS